MQAANSRHGYNLAAYIPIRHCHPTRRRSLLQSKVGPIVMIVPDVLTHKPFQVRLIQRDDIIEQTLKTARSTSGILLPQNRNSPIPLARLHTVFSNAMDRKR